MSDTTHETTASALLDAIAGDQDTDIVADPVEEQADAPREAAPETPETTPEPPADEPDSGADDIRAAPYIPPVRQDAAEQLAQIEQEIKALGVKLDNGDIETEQYHADLIKLHDARTQIQIERALAEQAAQAAAHADRNSWDSATKRFLSANPDYQDMTRQEPLAAIARLVMADEANQHKSPDWILGEAKRRLEAAFVPQSVQPPAARTEDDIKAAAKAKAAALKPSAPISISDIPGAPGAAASEFERLDQAGSGFSKIDALMSLPPDKLEAWMNRRI